MKKTAVVDLGAPSGYDLGTMPKLAYLGPALLALRKASGLTQEELAEALRTKNTKVSDYETGKAGMSLKRLFAVLEVLGADLAVLQQAMADAEKDDSDPNPPRSKYHYIAEQTGREQREKLERLEAELRRLRADVDDMKDSRG